MNEINKILSAKYKDAKYKDIKKLRGVEFNERMKLEFALRDTKNIEASNYLTIIYNNKKKNITNYTYRKVNDNTTEEVYNNYEHYFNINATIDKYDIRHKYFYNALPYYEENFSNEEDLITKINQSPEKYYQGTEIQLKSNLIFDNNVNLKINLAMPENELIDYIKKLSELYKHGKITKKTTIEKNYKTIFNVIGKKYVTDPKEFQKLLFIYDMHHTPEVNKNVTALFKELNKLLKMSVETNETSNEQKENISGLKEDPLKGNRLDDLSGKFKKALDNQLYLEL